MHIRKLLSTLIILGLSSKVANAQSVTAVDIVDPSLKNKIVLTVKDSAQYSLKNLPHSLGLVIKVKAPSKALLRKKLAAMKKKSPQKRIADITKNPFILDMTLKNTTLNKNYKLARERSLPYSVFGDSNGIVNGKVMDAGKYKLYVSVIDAANVNSVLAKYSLGFEFTDGSVPVSPTKSATPTPVTTATPVKTSTPIKTPVPTKTPVSTKTAVPTKTPVPTAIPTKVPTTVPTVKAPAPIIISGTDASGATLIGQVPFLVRSRAIYTHSDDSQYSSCLAITVPSQTSNADKTQFCGTDTTWSYVCPTDPNRKAWESQGDKVTSCIGDVSNRIASKNSVIVGAGTIQTSHFAWNFGDSGAKVSYNALDGWFASHVYDTPGTYTISLTVTNEAGKTSVVTRKIIAQAATRTIYYISAAGNDANNGLSENTPFLTLAKAQSVLRNKSDIELRFRRGDTFTSGKISGGLTIGSYGINNNNILVRGYGTGPNPKLLWSDGSGESSTIIAIGSQATNVTIQELALDTDKIKLFGTANYYGTSLPHGVAVAGKNIVLRNLEFLGVNYGAKLSNAENVLLIKSTNPTTGLRAYTLFNESSKDVFVMGNSSLNSVAEHTVRGIGQYERFYIYDNTLGSASISQGADGVSDAMKNTLTLQAGSFVWVSSNHMQGGPVAIGPLGKDRGTRGDRTDYVTFEGNTVSGAAPGCYIPGGDSLVSVFDGASHVKVTNNVITLADATHVGCYPVAIAADGYDSDYNRTVTDFLVAHNTIVSNKNYASLRGFRIERGSSQVRILNNLISAPGYNFSSNIVAPMWINGSGSVDSPTFDQLDSLGCNVINPPTLNHGKAFNIATDGFMYIANGTDSKLVTAAQWQTVLKPKRNNTTADTAVEISTYAVQGGVDEYIAVQGSADKLSCPNVVGVNADFYGRSRGTNVSAGAYQF